MTNESGKQEKKEFKAGNYTCLLTLGNKNKQGTY